MHLFNWVLIFSWVLIFILIKNCYYLFDWALIFIRIKNCLVVWLSSDFHSNQTLFGTCMWMKTVRYVPECFSMVRSGSDWWYVNICLRYVQSLLKVISGACGDSSSILTLPPPPPGCGAHNLEQTLHVPQESWRNPQDTREIPERCLWELCWHSLYEKVIRGQSSIVIGISSFAIFAPRANKCTPGVFFGRCRWL